jgi:hypothetical protein
MTTMALAVLVAGTGCKKKRASSTTSPDSSVPEMANLTVWQTRSYEDEESRFRVELPGVPIESEETDSDPATLVVRHMAQFRDGESELLLMWNDLSAPVEDDEAERAVLDEVLGGWSDAGLEMKDGSGGQLGTCATRALRGTLEKQPIEGRIAICDATLIQIVASGTYVEDAKRVFDSFVWLR